jgi:signal transduction histidine kinase
MGHRMSDTAARTTFKVVTDPDYPPRARIEWVTAGARVVLAVGGLFAMWLDPSATTHRTLTDTLLGLYVGYSLAMLALVWKPIEFARTSGLAAHIVDLVVFSVITSLTQGASSPFFVYFVFSVIAGALRWDAKGALLTAGAALALYGGISAYQLSTNPDVQLDRFVLRIAQLAVVAALLAYVGSYHPRAMRELLRFASWPHLLREDEEEVAAEIIDRANDVLPAPRILLLWGVRGEDYLSAAWRGDSGVESFRETRSLYEPLVVAALRDASFQARNAADPAGQVDFWYKGRFRRLSAAPVHDAIQQRFSMHAVQSSRIYGGGVVEGRLFWLDRKRMRIDDLVVGDLVARLAASRLESAVLLTSIRDAAAFNERIRVARDLHDSVLQALAGTGLQLAVARRLLDRDPAAARIGLQEVQGQLEQSEAEMRALIRRLRPQPRESAEGLGQPLITRLQAFARRIEQQWRVDVVMQLTPALEDVPGELMGQTLLVVQEAILNAAKHSGGTRIEATLDSGPETVTVQVADNGKGFPFTGSFGLADLTALDSGPLTLRERVTELRGDLHIRSGPSGSTVRITLPLRRPMPAHDGHIAPAR